MKRPPIALTVVVVVFLVAAFAVIIYSSMELQQFSVESCITYKGKTACGTAAGATREEALSAAATIACSSLASGMSESIACSRTEPDSIRWLEE